jgi:REP element-mobilizing transposase RayT
MSRRKPKQLTLPIKGRGGPRPGAGRPKKPGAGVPHLRRATFAARHPLHITLKLRREIGDLRTDSRFRRIQRAFFYAGERFGMRLIHFSVQGDHIHLIVEATGREALAKGMQGLTIRIARAINRHLQRRGAVFADRYHVHILKSVAEVRHAVHYVLYNRHHHVPGETPWYIDPFSSAAGEARWYVDEKWRSAYIIRDPTTWLLKNFEDPRPRNHAR